MNSTQFSALIVKEQDGKFIREIAKRDLTDLPEGDVLIKVKYSSLNYKDALSASGNKGVTRVYPHTPGIDAAGIVEASESSMFTKGQEVIVTGYDLGMNTSGGFGQYIRVPASWIVKKPENLSLKESMIFGTAGFTAALALYELERSGMSPSKNEILVTGATGGVGTFAVILLSKQNYNVTAETGKQDKEPYLISLGAKNVIGREELLTKDKRALLNQRWGGVIDTVGGEILANSIKASKYGSSVASCGNAASGELNLTVYPFILRSVNLLGINTEKTPMHLRLEIWNKLANEWKPENLDDIHEEVTLNELNDKIDLILKGQITGRILLNLEFNI